MRFIKKILKRSELLMGLYRTIRDQSPLRRDIKYRSHLGLKFNGTASMENGNFEPIETEIFKNNINDFDLFINIGANMGYYVMIALKHNKQTIAFEPNATNLEILCNNLIANNFEKKCEIHPIALCNSIGVMPLYGANTGASLIKGWADQHNSRQVPTNKLDNIIGERLNNKKTFVLMDIEGAEYECLLGASKLLNTANPQVFLIEISVSEHQPTGILINPNLTKTFKLFFNAGYKCIKIGSTCEEVHLDEVERVEKTLVDTLKTHNFIFYNRQIDPKTMVL